MARRVVRFVLAVVWMAPLAACVVHGTDQEAIRVNQLGFMPDSIKQAVVVSGAAGTVRLTNIATGLVAHESPLSTPLLWPASGERVRIADFSVLRSPGRYRLTVDGIGGGVDVEIREDVWGELADASLKAFYYNRSGSALLPAHAGKWARAAGHPDTRVLVHVSAASGDRPAGTPLSASYGWYDAGDYNKYVVNSGISTYTLLAAYEHFPGFFQRQNLDIPESGNGIPDVLDEAYWNLRWLLAMQDPGDGGVYHKLTTLNFAGAVMPSEAEGQRYIVQKTTAASLDFAAVLAVAGRVFAGYEEQLPGFAARCRRAAVKAYEWALRNSETLYTQPDDVHTGEYGDDDLTDEFLWAATELRLVGAVQLDPQAIAAVAPLTTPSWNDVGALAYVSLHAHQAQVPPELRQTVVSELLRYADQLIARRERSPYGVPYGADLEDFHWGGNSTALNQSLLLIRAFEASGNRAYLDAATANFDYVLGRNATGFSFVTGFGVRPPQRIHHRVSESDGVESPVPGFLVGGPNRNRTDGCEYPSRYPARSYLDDWCSYTTNEVAINWNAPLVYVASALRELLK